MGDKLPQRFIDRKLAQLKPYCPAVELDKENICIAKCPRWQELLETGVCPANTDYFNAREKVDG